MRHLTRHCGIRGWANAAATTNNNRWGWWRRRGGRCGHAAAADVFGWGGRALRCHLNRGMVKYGHNFRDEIDRITQEHGRNRDILWLRNIWGWFLMYVDRVITDCKSNVNGFKDKWGCCCCLTWVRPHTELNWDAVTSLGTFYNLYYLTELYYRLSIITIYMVWTIVRFWKFKIIE